MTNVREDSFTEFDYSEFVRVVDRLLTPVAGIASDSTLLYANDVAASLVDSDVSHVVGKKMLSFIHPDDRARVSGELEKITNGELQAEFTQYRLRGKQGNSWRTIDSYAHNLIEDPLVRGILVSGGDVTDEMTTKRELKQSQQFLLAITDNMAEWMITTDRQGIITFVNAAAERLFKLSSSELLGSTTKAAFKLRSAGEYSLPEEKCPPESCVG
jgi:PAS domain-containing protein